LYVGEGRVYGEGLLPERSVSVNEARGTKMTQVKVRMAIAELDRQGQAAHRQYKSCTLVEFTSGKSMHNRHSQVRKIQLITSV